jgi:uncharacterized lipoprotein YbaY
MRNFRSSRNAVPLVRVAIVALTIMLIGCADGEGQPQEPAVGEGGVITISGEVTYLPRIALPSDAVVHLWLEDAAADRSEARFAEHRVPTTGRQVPIPFDVRVSSDSIDAERRYRLHAEIRSEAGIVLWHTDSPPHVITRGAPTEGIEIRLRQRGGEDAAVEPQAG